MSLSDGNKLNRIEELKSKLFNRNYKTRIEHHDVFQNFQKREVMDSWEKKEDTGPDFSEKFFVKTSLFKKFFIFSVFFFILSLGYAAYIFFAKGNTISNDNIDILVQSNAFTAGGEEYPLLLEIVNRNNSPIEFADLVLEYPKSSETNSSQDNEHVRISLGTIPAGGIKNENTKLMLLGEQGSIRPIKITIEYRVEGSNAIFVKDKLFEVSINSTPINLSIDAPTEASSNEDVNFNVKATLNSTKMVSKMLLKIDYPIGFQFVKSTPMPSLGNNIWNLGDLAPGAERNISLVGKMVDVFNGEEKVFRVWSGSQSATDKSLIGVVFNSAEHTVMIKKSSIEAKLLINGVYQREYVIDTKTPIQGQIQWINNLETKINNLEIRAKISGNSLDRKTISANQGFYNSLEDSIIWDKNSQSKFIEVSPGDTGSVSFSFSPLLSFSTLGGIIPSPSINIDVSIRGDQSQNGGINTKLNNGESKIIKIISDVGFSNKALFYSGPFTNSGPIPPKTAQKTTYTIVWSLSNTSNNISNAQIRSTMPSWMRFVGIFSPQVEDISYDSFTKEIVWNIGVVPKGTSLTAPEKSVYFQVEFTPSLSQIGTAPVIINDAILTGHDDFANVDVRVKKSILDTKLFNDFSFPVNGGIVVE